MDVVIPPNIVEALLGGGLVALTASAVLEWLKTRPWWPWKSGDILILWSVALGVAVSTLFLTLGWVEGDVTLLNAIGFGVASGLGASIARDLIASVLRPQQTLTIVEVAGDVGEAELAAALKVAEGSGPVETE